MNYGECYETRCLRGIVIYTAWEGRSYEKQFLRHDVPLREILSRVDAALRGKVFLSPFILAVRKMNSHHHPRSPLVAAVAAFIILAATVVVARAIVIFAVAVTATVAIATAIATTVVTLEGNLLLELVVVAAIWAHVPFWAAPKLIKCMAPPIEQRRALLLGLVAFLAALLNTGTG